MAGEREGGNKNQLKTRGLGKSLYTKLVRTSQTQSLIYTESGGGLGVMARSGMLHHGMTQGAGHGSADFHGDGWEGGLYVKIQGFFCIYISFYI